MSNVEFPDKRRRRKRIIRLILGLVVLTAVAMMALKPGFEWMAKNAIHGHREHTGFQWLAWSDRLGGESGVAAFLRARAYRHLGEMDASAKALLRAQKLGISSQKLQREQWLGKAQSGLLREVEPFLSKLLIDPQEDLEEICEAYFLGFVRNQKSGPALELLKNWIADSPDRARPYILRARFWNLKLNPGEAQKDLERAIAIEPTNPEAIIELASALQQNHDYEKSVIYYQKSLADPRYAARAHLGLASCYKVQGQSDRVQTVLQDALRIAPENSQVHIELGRLEFEAGRYRSSIDHFRQALAVEAHNHEIHYLLGQALSVVGEADEAKTHFEVVRKFQEGGKELIRLEEQLTENPRDVEKLVRAGEILLEIADPQEGVVRLLAALEIEPKHPKACQLLAEHYKRQAVKHPEFQQLFEKYENANQQ